MDFAKITPPYETRIVSQIVAPPIDATLTWQVACANVVMSLSYRPAEPDDGELHAPGQGRLGWGLESLPTLNPVLPSPSPAPALDQSVSPVNQAPTTPNGAPKIGTKIGTSADGNRGQEVPSPVKMTEWPDRGQETPNPLQGV